MLKMPSDRLSYLEVSYDVAHGRLCNADKRERYGFHKSQRT